MTQFDRISSWIILAAVAAAFLGAVSWAVAQTVWIAPVCGPVAERQLRTATDEMAQRIRGLRFDEADTSCDSYEAIGVSWTHDDYNKLLAEVSAAGCELSSASAMADDEDAPLFTCHTAGGTAEFELDDVSGHSATGWMGMR